MPFFFIYGPETTFAFSISNAVVKTVGDLIKSAFCMYKYRYLVKLAFVVIISTQFTAPPPGKKILGTFLNCVYCLKEKLCKN